MCYLFYFGPNICTIACGWRSCIKPERLGTAVSHLRNYPGFGEALGLLVDSDIAERRRTLAAVRKRSDDWYFERFHLNW